MEQQNKIGLKRMIRGCMATGWLAIASLGVSHLEWKMFAFQELLWEHCIEPWWKMQNDIIFHKVYQYIMTDNEHLMERLKWYITNRSKVLSQHGQLLVSIDINSLHRMPC